MELERELVERGADERLEVLVVVKVEPDVVVGVVAVAAVVELTPVVVGGEAGSVDEGIGLTEPVAKAVPRAARAVEESVAALQGPGSSAASRQEC